MIVEALPFNFHYNDLSLIQNRPSLYSSTTTSMQKPDKPIVFSAWARLELEFSESVVDHSPTEQYPPRSSTLTHLCFYTIILCNDLAVSLGILSKSDAGCEAWPFDRSNLTEP